MVRSGGVRGGGSEGWRDGGGEGEVRIEGTWCGVDG